MNRKSIGLFSLVFLALFTLAACSGTQVATDNSVLTAQDTDGDGVINSSDAFPLDPNESVDTDGDGTGNNADLDDDNDGTSDISDAFPLDNHEIIDTDGDGVGDNADTDDDNDGVLDEDDYFLLDPGEFVDNDGDGLLDEDRRDNFPNCPPNRLGVHTGDIIIDNTNFRQEASEQTKNRLRRLLGNEICIIEGTVKILNTHLDNLSPLSHIAYIVGPKSFLGITDNDSLTSLTGLESLKTIGQRDPEHLADITRTFGNLIIQNNNVLSNLDGLRNLELVGANLAIQGNPSLNIRNRITAPPLTLAVALDALEDLGLFALNFNVGRNIVFMNNFQRR